MVGAGWSAATDSAPRALTFQCPQLQSRNKDKERGTNRGLASGNTKTRRKAPRGERAI